METSFSAHTGYAFISHLYRVRNWAALNMDDDNDDDDNDDSNNDSNESEVANNVYDVANINQAYTSKKAYTSSRTYDNDRRTKGINMITSVANIAYGLSGLDLKWQQLPSESCLIGRDQSPQFTHEDNKGRSSTSSSGSSTSSSSSSSSSDSNISRKEKQDLIRTQRNTGIPMSMLKRKKRSTTFSFFLLLEKEEETTYCCFTIV